MEPHVVVNNAPVLMGVMLLAVLVHRVGSSGSVPPSAVVMDTDLVYRAGLAGLPVLMVAVINISTNVLNINDNSNSL